MIEELICYANFEPIDEISPPLFAKRGIVKEILTNFESFSSDFRRNGRFMLGVVFFIQSIFADRNNNSQQKFFIFH